MDEYIKREDAIKAIAYNELDKHIPKGLVDIALMVAQAKIMGIPAADVAPKNEVAREILSDLKKKIHDRAVYTGSRDIPNYIDLKTLDAIIDKIAKGVG